MGREENEKRRVIDNTKKAIRCLRAAKTDLDAAFVLGIVDVMGGMYVISGLKLLKIEAAKKHIQEAMEYLQKFRNEADHTDYVHQKYMHLGGIGTVLDIGIDGIGPDIYTQARIAGLRSRVKEAIRRVEVIMKAVNETV